jgi:hypothetical protein
MTKDEALNLALYALELEDMACRYEKEATPEHIAKAITALRTAIEEAEKQEPVACVIDGDLYFHHEIDWEDLAYQGNGVELLYTTPPAAQREWVGLTDEEIIDVIHPLVMADLSDEQTDYEIAKAIEAKLREKNNG